MSKIGPLTLGTVRADGRTFSHYDKRPNGRVYEMWYAPEQMLRRRISIGYFQAKRRADEKCLPFNIDVDYLLTIFPKDGMCPALHIKMVWGGHRDTSPSLDRIIPTLGYVKGNVAYISDRANRIKSDATTDEVISVANYLKDMNYS